MDKESSFCSSCESILQYSSSIGEPYTPNKKIYQLTQKNNIERSINNYENDSKIIDTIRDGIDFTQSYVHKNQEANEDFIEKLMVYTNKKRNQINLPNKPNLATYVTHKNIAYKNTFAKSRNNDFNNKINHVKVSHTQDIEQNNDCKTAKAKTSIQDEKNYTDIVNNGSHNIAQSILDYRKNILQIVQSILELSNHIDNMRKLILHETNKRQCGVLSNNKTKKKNWID